MAVTISFESVTKCFGATRAVDDVTLRIEAGELFFLLGPSGCGKTTLLRCLAGFYEPDAGTIRIGDRDVTRMAPYERDTGMVFQSYALWPHLTVRENVAFGLEMRRCQRDEAGRRVDEALAMVRMADKAAARPNELSGGQQQRVALARALVVRPQCLLLDEPLSNLDAKLRLEMRGEIRRICKEAGLTAVYVTHDQKESLAMADRMAVMVAGRIRQVGAPQTIYRQPADGFVAEFIGETNFLAGKVERVESGLVVVTTPIGAVRTAAGKGVQPVPGANVKVSIRPEAVRLGVPPAGAPNAWTGRLHNTVYLGETAQHRVTISSGGSEATWKVFELNPKVLARDDARQTAVWVDPEDAIILES
jgi:iron(III) transport system ATP-binding protein